MSDLISRSALIEAIKEDAETRLLGYEGGISLGEMKEWVENQPTVEANPLVHGEWKSIRDKDKKKCSVCGVIHLIAQYPFGNANFCPNCGADMRGGKNE